MRKFRRAATAALLFTLAIFMVGVAGRQDQEVKQQVRVRLRLVSVTVRDGQGQPVKGLNKEDFSLLVDGRPVEIRSLDERDYSGVRHALEQGQAASQVNTDLPPRRIIFLFDGLSSSMQPLNGSVQGDSHFAAKSAEARGTDDPDPEPYLRRGTRQAKLASAAEVMRGMLPNDEVAVVEINPAPRLLQTYTTDRRKIAAAIDQLSLPQNLTAITQPSIESGGEVETTARQAEILNRQDQIGSLVSQQLTMYEHLADIMAQLPGAKQVILFSEGFPVIANSGDRAAINQVLRLDYITSVLASSGTRVSTISIAGIDSPQLGSPEENTLASLAADTGGEYFRPGGRLESALHQALTGFDSTYELFFAPPNADDGAFHAIDVQLNIPDLQVIAPKGYLGERSFEQTTDVQRQAMLDRAFWQPLLANDLGVTLTPRVLPYGNGLAALHYRAVFSEDAPREAAAYDVHVNLGRDNEVYDSAAWRIDSRAAEPRQVDLLLPIPGGDTSFQFALQAATLGKFALDIGAFSVPAQIAKPLIGPVYLSFQGVTEPQNITVSDPPKKSSLDLPPALTALVHEPEALAALPGERIRAGFVYAGQPVSALFFQIKSGDQAMAMIGEDFAGEPLADDLVILHGTFTVPPLPPGDAELVIIAQVENRKIQLAVVPFSIRAGK